MTTATYKRLVAGPARVRELFCDVIEAAYNGPSIDDPIADERKRYLRSKLWFCSSIIPSGTRAMLRDLSDDGRERMTYAQAVRSPLFRGAS
jgi:hypothetical protein